MPCFTAGKEASGKEPAEIEVLLFFGYFSSPRVENMKFLTPPPPLLPPPPLKDFP